MIIEIAIYLVAGAFAGLLAGLLGIGGGLVLVPILSTAFLIFLDSPYSVHMAIATSLATILVTSLSSVNTHHRHQAVRWDILKTMILGVLLGAFLGAWSAQFFSTSILAKLFGLMELLVAWQLLSNRKPSPQRQLPGLLAQNSVGAGIGGLSSLLGVGGGSLSTPYLLWHNIKAHQAIATSAALSLPVALSGTAAYMLAGIKLEDLPDYTSGFVYWPAFLAIVTMSVFTAHWGAKLAHRTSVDLLKKAFAVLLIILGVKMLFF
ncbi:sulfite exporter TauE/SafE family protein [Thiomicrospira microaerophila]|uniref:sulfite exporter TauE/SafE family protein n=1 Tax=Thiomicrospira microaerophila TaxID=406020 RepID=UPI00200F52EC|nr:sulfite exporter TauE/SafE family protein [Thiomicrospira microaerophila]UQB42337.1 sulfite exporter TauE/SafE family protein [Thiomicrospira microaerophila]